MLHITLVTFRDAVDPSAARRALMALAQDCLDAHVLIPSDAEAERSWHACIEVRGAVQKTLGSAAWSALMAAVVADAEVYKAWTFASTDSEANV